MFLLRDPTPLGLHDPEIPMTDPTSAQLVKFYQVVRQAVLMSSYLAFVEMGSDGDLYVYFGRYDNPTSRMLLTVNPEGELST